MRRTIIMVILVGSVMMMMHHYDHPWSMWAPNDYYWPPHCDDIIVWWWVTFYSIIIYSSAAFSYSYNYIPGWFPFGQEEVSYDLMVIVDGTYTIIFCIFGSLSIDGFLARCRCFFRGWRRRVFSHNTTEPVPHCSSKYCTRDTQLQYVLYSGM